MGPTAPAPSAAPSAATAVSEEGPTRDSTPLRQGAPGPDLLAANLALLRQAAQLLAGLSDGAYATAPGERVAPVGGHLRHVIEHYAEFLGGLAASRVDYAARRRDPEVERRRDVALDRVASLIAALEGLAAGGGRALDPSLDLDQPLSVRDEDDDDVSDGAAPGDDGKSLTAAGADTTADGNARGRGGDGGWALSSVRRELQFLQSHTVHHFALIDLGLRLGGLGLGVTLPEGFGVAPSTLRHRERTRRQASAPPAARTAQPRPAP